MKLNFNIIVSVLFLIANIINFVLAFIQDLGYTNKKQYPWITRLIMIISLLFLVVFIVMVMIF